MNKNLVRIKDDLMDNLKFKGKTDLKFKLKIYLHSILNCCSQ